MTTLNDPAVLRVVQHVRNAPEDMANVLTQIYGRWCREQPSTFSPSSLITQSLPQIPEEIHEYTEEFARLVNESESNIQPVVPVLLTEDYGIELLWCLHEGRAQTSERLLYSFLPALRPLEDIRRGGINVYKRFSWTMHIMAVCRVLWLDLPSGNLPPTILWPESTLNAMSLMSSEYSHLDANEIRLLRVACILHDIGVRDGVEGHDKKGIPYVAAAIAPLGGPTTISDLISGILSPSETLIALQALVGEHTLASKVNGEEGPQHIKAHLDKWLELAPKGSKLRSFLENSFPRLLANFLICDIVGVADELLTTSTIKRTAKSIKALSNMISAAPVPSPTTLEGAERLGTLIGIESVSEVIRLMVETFRLTDQINQILLSISAAELLDYAMGILKPLEAPKVSAAILAELIGIWHNLGPSVSQHPIEIRFSPHCNLSAMHDWGQALLKSITDTSPERQRVNSRTFGIEIEIVGQDSTTQIHVRTINEQA